MNALCDGVCGAIGYYAIPGKLNSDSYTCETKSHTLPSMHSRHRLPHDSAWSHIARKVQAFFFNMTGPVSSLVWAFTSHATH